MFHGLRRGAYSLPFYFVRIQIHVVFPRLSILMRCSSEFPRHELWRLLLSTPRLSPLNILWFISKSKQVQIQIHVYALNSRTGCLPIEASISGYSMLFLMISVFLHSFCIVSLRERIRAHQSVGVVVIDLLLVGLTVLILFLLFLTTIT